MDLVETIYLKLDVQEKRSCLNENIKRIVGDRDTVLIFWSGGRVLESISNLFFTWKVFVVKCSLHSILLSYHYYI